MKLTYENFEYAIGVVGSLKNPSIRVPVFENVRIECVDGTVWFSTASGESRLSVPVEAEPGSENELVSIPVVAKSIIPAIMKTCPEDGYIHIADGGTKTILDFGGGNVSKFYTVDPNILYERLTFDDNNVTATFPGTLFSDAIRAVIPAIGKGKGAVALDGVHFGVSGNGLAYLECADGYRMARAYLSEYTGDGIDVIIPAAAAQEIAKITKHSDHISIANKGNELVIKTDTGIVYATQLLFGEFPKMDSLLNVNLTTKLVCQRSDVIAAATATTAVESYDMLFSTQPDGVLISSVGEGGDVNVKVGDVIESPAEGMGFRVGAKYMMDAARTFGGGFVIGASGERAPILLKDSTQVHVIMPVLRES